MYIKNFVVLPYNNEIAKAYARIVVDRERQGQRISIPDAWIAVTAIWYDLPLVTHDRDFAGISRLQLITEPDS